MLEAQIFTHYLIEKEMPCGISIMVSHLHATHQSGCQACSVSVYPLSHPLLLQVRLGGQSLCLYVLQTYNYWFVGFTNFTMQLMHIKRTYFYTRLALSFAAFNIATCCKASSRVADDDGRPNERRASLAESCMLW